MKFTPIREKCLYKFVLLDHVLRIDPRDVSLAAPNVHLWEVKAVQNRRVVLSNLSTDHRVELDARNIKQFDERVPQMPADAMGAFVLRSPGAKRLQCSQVAGRLLDSSHHSSADILASCRHYPSSGKDNWWAGLVAPRHGIVWALVSASTQVGH